MKNQAQGPHQFNSLSEAHRAHGLPAPKHPLISLISPRSGIVESTPPPGPHVLHFYKISYRPRLSSKLKYGQGYYDFDEGGLLFAAPNQVIGSNEEEEADAGPCSRYTLLIHPDYLLNYPLAKKIKQYGFFSYATNEALHLSEEEKQTIIAVFDMMAAELDSRIDEMSQDVVIAQIELLLNYAQRFYKRQFITRKAAGNELLQKLESILDNYFGQEESLNRGIPTVQYLAGELNISASYLSDMLRALTGKNARQHIHDKLIEKAKEMLSTTRLSVGEVAYILGFEHSQSFSKFFKTRTQLSPLEFRKSFN